MCVCVEGEGHRVFLEGCYPFTRSCVEKDIFLPTSSHLLWILGLSSRGSGVGSQGISVLRPAPWALSYPSLRPRMG